MGRGSEVVGNKIYGTPVGVLALPGFYGHVHHNTIYDTSVDAIRLDGASNGLTQYRVFERDFFWGDTVADFDSLTPVASGSTENGLDLGVRTRDRNVGISYFSTIEIPTGGEWTFNLSSSDGSRIYLDGGVLIDNDGRHSVSTRSATVTLNPGQHDLRVDYFNWNNRTPILEVTWSGPGVAEETLPLSAFAAAAALRAAG